MKITAALFALTFLLFGCGSSVHTPPAAITDSATSVATASDPPKESVTDVDSGLRPLTVRAWTPKFIATGLASGIMIEFTGVKKDKPLHARYAGIELRRYPAVPQSEEENGKQLTWNQKGDDVLAATFEPRRIEPFALSTTINDVKQAFFKVPPGKYLLRQTK